MGNKKQFALYICSVVAFFAALVFVVLVIFNIVSHSLGGTLVCTITSVLLWFAAVVLAYVGKEQDYI